MRHLRGLRRHGKREHGQILVLFELVMIMMLGFAAMVVDLGVLRNNRQILVNTLDAAALTGGSKLPVDGKLASADPHSWQSVQTAIQNNIAVNYPGLTLGTDYTISYRCLIGADLVTGHPLISRDITGVCDPHNALHHTPPLYAVDSDFTGAGPHLVSACDPTIGDKCNVVVITGSSTTKYALTPAIPGAPASGSTGTVVSAACKGACGAATVVPVDLVIILDRTGSMADGADKSGAKIQALQAAAETVLSVYDPAKQRVGLVLTGPGKVDASGHSASGTCPSGGSGLGVGDDNNFSPQTYLTTTGTTNLFQGTFLSTALNTSMTKTTPALPATLSVASTSGFPATGTFTIQIDSEQMTAKVGTVANTLIVTARPINGTSTGVHTLPEIVTWGVSKTDTSIRVNDATRFPTTNNFTIQVDSEQMLVTAGAGTTTWTVQRGYKLGGGSTTTALHGGNGGDEMVNQVYPTSATSIKVNDWAGFPNSGSYTVKIDTEQMLVTAGAGTTTWTVTRAQNGTAAATHTGGTAVTRVVGKGDTSIQVTAPYGPAFPSVPFMIAVAPSSGSYEHMLVTAASSSGAPYTWTVTRAQDGTAAASHNTGANVDGVAPWVPSDATIGVWMPVGLSGTDTNSVRALPSPRDADGTYSIGGAYQPGTPIVDAINCIQAVSQGTNLTTPIQMAQWYLDNYGRQGVTQGIILETDGHPQVGFEGVDQTTTNTAYTCQAALAAAAAAKADTTNSPDGIQFFTIGYGVDSTSKCPTYTATLTNSNTSQNIYESRTGAPSGSGWSGQSAATLLSLMATDADHYFPNPATSELAGVFAQAATILAKGGAHLINLYPQPVVTGFGIGSVSGLYFTGAISVTFGGAAATFSAASVTDTSIPITLPAGLVHGQTYPVIVTTPGGSSVITAASQYTYP